MSPPPRFMLVTDRGASLRPLPDAVAAAVRGGVDLVQVREGGLPARELLALVRELLGPVREGGARIVVNDRIDVALAAGADGVHLKRVSLPVAAARRIVGEDLLVGASTHDEEEIDRAFAEGADYVVFGPVFPTPSKAGLIEPRGPARFAAAAGSAPGPVLALGGVSAETLPALLGGPLPGIAVIRAVLGRDDPGSAARELAALLGSGGRAP